MGLLEKRVLVVFVGNATVGKKIGIKVTEVAEGSQK